MYISIVEISYVTFTHFYIINKKGRENTRYYIAISKIISFQVASDIR